MGAIGFLVTWLAVALAASVGPTDSVPARCSISVSPPLRSDASVEVLAVGLHEVVHASSPSYAPGARVELAGQSLELLSVTGNGAHLLASEDPPTSVVLVLWDFDGACFPIPFAGAQLLVEDGDTVLVSGHLRPAQDWVGGRPTIDSFFAGAFVYPQTSVMGPAYVTRNTPPRHAPNWTRRTRLSASELFDLITQLPGYCDYARKPEQALASQLRVAWSLRGRERVAPVSELLRRHQFLVTAPPAAEHCALLLFARPFG